MPGGRLVKPGTQLEQGQGQGQQGQGEGDEMQQQEEEELFVWGRTVESPWLREMTVRARAGRRQVDAEKLGVPS